MAIQGLTPDPSHLASSLLLRLVGSSLASSSVAPRDAAPAPTPNHNGEHDGVPGEICSFARADAALRVRLDNGGRPWIPFLPIEFLYWPCRLAARSFDPARVVLRGSHGLIRSLCRFLC
jgi:hypothetical protein